MSVKDNIQNMTVTTDTETSRSLSGRLDADRLAAAVDAVAERYDPDQIILFGSAARGEMTEGSDIDLLVINDHGHAEAVRRERMRVNGDRIDVVQMRREDLERQRRTAATIQEAALSQGITVRASCEKRVRPSFCLRPRGERGSADGTQRSQDDSDRHCGRGAGAAGVHGACLPVMRASTREEMRRISSTSRSSSRLFSIHSR